MMAGRDLNTIRIEKDLSRWSGDSSNSPESYLESEFNFSETYEERLEGYRDFFDNGSLTRCFDDKDDRLMEE
jgi:hypothetical protein